MIKILTYKNNISDIKHFSHTPYSNVHKISEIIMNCSVLWNEMGIVYLFIVITVLSFNYFNPPERYLSFFKLE